MMIIVLILLVGTGVFGVAWIKIVNGSEYESDAISNQMKKVQDKIINPNRGSILDRNMQSFAVSSTVYNIILDIRVLAEQSAEVQNETIQGLSETLDVDPQELKELVKINTETGKPNKDTNWYTVKKQVSFELGRKIREKNLKCVYEEEDTKRFYTHDSLASQVIGFMRGDAIWGLEYQYDSNLVGTVGRIFRTYESDNSIVTREIEPKTGDSLVTTLDQTIQQYAENICKKAYEECKPNHVPLNTSIIVMDPNTSEILAMAEYPTFSLNNPDNISLMEDPDYKEKWNKLSDEDITAIKNNVWKNFNVTDTFEPGSIFKPIVVAAAYEEGLISANDTFYCGGKKVFNEKDSISCHNRAGHGTQNVQQVLENSCNVGMMDIVSKLGREKFYQYQRDFGFGEKSGIDLPKEARASSDDGAMYSLEELNTVELATSSFGQGFNCTAVQAINAFAAVINGGNLMRPYVVSQIIDQDGKIVHETSPKVVRKVISEQTSDFLRKSMETVVSIGTGKKAAIEGYSIGGKTGTAQQLNRNDGIYTLSFITYFPVENPQYICMMVIHHPENYEDGVVSPAPYIKELMQDIINYKNIPPSYESDEIDTGVSEAEVVINDYTNQNLSQTIKELNSLGIDFELVGSGGDIVTKQRPAGGSKVTVGNSILLFIGTSENSPELIAVPDVVDLTVDEAVNYLTSLGFDYSIYDNENKTKTDEDNENNENEDTENEDDEKSNKNETNPKVYQQIPAAGANIEKGTIVKIKIKNE